MMNNITTIEMIGGWAAWEHLATLQQASQVLELLVVWIVRHPDVLFQQPGVLLVLSRHPAPWW
jgi:hypothetical protein